MFNFNFYRNETKVENAEYVAGRDVKKFKHEDKKKFNRSESGEDENDSDDAS